MHYVMSDIHGCYNEYLELLDQMDLESEDELFVLGDCVDRGYAPMAVLQDMMMRPNVFPIIGNHDLEASIFLKKLSVEITEDNYDSHLDGEIMGSLTDWLQDGGEYTLTDYERLSVEEREAILEYLDEFSTYEEIEVDGKTFVLVHGGMEPFDPDKEMDEYGLTELVWSRSNYNEPYFEDKFTVTGHTPTVSVPGNNGTIIKRNNHIAIDCGCVHGFNLAAYCLETGEEFYAPFVGE